MKVWWLNAEMARLGTCHLALAFDRSARTHLAPAGRSPGATVSSLDHLAELVPSLASNLAARICIGITQLTYLAHASGGKATGRASDAVIPVAFRRVDMSIGHDAFSEHRPLLRQPIAVR